MRSNPAGLSRVIYPRFPETVYHHLRMTAPPFTTNALHVFIIHPHMQARVFPIFPNKKRGRAEPGLLYVKNVCMPLRSSPYLVASISAAHVIGPTSPSGSSPLSIWKWIT